MRFAAAQTQRRLVKMDDRLKSGAKRIGLLVPSSNTVMEPDFYRALPQDWSLHTARMYLESVTEAGEQRMLNEFTFPAVRDLASAQPDVIVFGCTSAGALRGNAHDAWLTREITERTGIPAVSVIGALRKGIRKLGARRLVIATPYIAPLNVHIQVSLQEDGLEVMNIAGLGIRSNPQIALVSQEDILAIAHQAVGSLAPDLLFLSCTNFPAMRALPALNEAFPFPVISSNQVTLEAAMAAALQHDQ